MGWTAVFVSRAAATLTAMAGAAGFIVGVTIGMVAGCDSGSKGPVREVVVYTALDEEFSRPILEEFSRATGTRALAVYDTESTKSVGLTTRIRSEAARPRCDVFWNNEPLNTLRLKADGLLQPCHPKHAEDYPAEYRDAEGCWYGFAARARVIVVNTGMVAPGDYPRSIRDLAHERFRTRAGIAKPLFGSTASHVACLFAALGPAPAQDLLMSWKKNDIQVLGGNKACAEMVGAGKLAAAMTDTDDAVAERDAGRPVAIIFPDGGDGGMGTPVFPNALSVVKGAPHAAEAERLIDYLLSPEVEARLAEGASAQMPLGGKCAAKARVGKIADIRAMAVDIGKAAAEFDAASRFVEGQFLK